MPLPQHPARVKVTLADGTAGWLADPPEAPIGAGSRWRLVDDRADLLIASAERHWDHASRLRGSSVRR